MKQLILLLFTCSPVWAGSCTGVTNLPSGASACFYIANSGLDTNTGADEAHPWANAPDMSGCASSCAAHTPASGDVFVFRGCDTWTVSGSTSPFVNVSQSGTSSNLISYGGYDQSWFNSGVCASAWNRPIFSGGGTWPGTTANAKFFATPGSHVNIDWIEFTATNMTGAGNVDGIDYNVGADINVSNTYWHGMSASALSGSSAGFAAASGSCAGKGTFHDNYVDLSDSSATAQGVWQGTFLQGGCAPDLYRNYFSNLMTCANGTYTTVHDNTFNNCAIVTSGNGLHENVFESNGDASNGSLYYNNLVNNVQTSSPIVFQIGPLSGTTSYAFNNVAVNSASGSIFFNCSNGGAGSTTIGTCIAFNNTIECGADGGAGPNQNCSQIGDHSDNGTMNAEYNYFITSGLACTVKGGIGTCSTTGNILHSQATANSNGYTAANYFSPTAANSESVGTGGLASTMTGICSTIGSVFGATHQTACLNDTTRGVAINTSTHQVTGPARTTVARPGSGSWDVGAYQFSSGTPAPPPAPWIFADIPFIAPATPFVAERAVKTSPLPTGNN